MIHLSRYSVRARIISLVTLLLVFFAGFGLFTIGQVETLDSLSESIYEHPLQVSNAALRASAGILRMHRGMKDMTLSRSQREMDMALATVQAEEQDVYRNLELISDKIIGEDGQRKVKESIKMFADWTPIREEVASLALQGNTAEASLITRQRGAAYVAGLEREMNALASYARSKADQYMEDFNATHDNFNRMLLLGIGLVTLLCLATAAVVIRSITHPLSFLKDSMAACIVSGEIKTVTLPGRNEIADLAEHFNALGRRVDEQMWLSSSLNALNREFEGELAVEEVADRSLAFIARNMQACIGSFYLVDSTQRHCSMAASYAFVERNQLANRFAYGEGIVGQVALEKRPILLKNISRADACAVTGTTSEPPRCIYAMPIQYEQGLLGVLEIASFEMIEGTRKQFIDQGAEVIASQLNIAIQSQRISDLLLETQDKNDLLQSQSTEIGNKNLELGLANSELQAQRDELQHQAGELKAQAVELEAQRIEVEEANRLKSEFLSNMSHELRTPLNSILSLSQLILRRGAGSDPTQTEEFLTVIDRNGRHLLGLINDILDLTKIEAGHMIIVSTHFESSSLLERLRETIQPLATEKGLALHVDADAAPTLVSDEEKIFQILLNLLSNAVKFTETGSVSLEVRNQDDMAAFLVSDTGVGIPMESQELIFDEFRQIDGSFTREHEGSGLGLTISRKMARLMGGDIHVQSAPGKGSAFTLTLPVISQKADAFCGHSRQPGTPLAEKPLVWNDRCEPLRILVMEDNDIASMQIRCSLEESGIEVLTASDGAEGLERLGHDLPDGIVLDLMMPKIDGFQVLERLRAHPETARLPVLVLTAKDLTHEENEKLAQHKVCVLMQKGATDREQLIGCVTRMCASRSMNRAPLNFVRSEKTVRPGCPPRILIVEDNPDNRITIAAILDGEGSELHFAVDGQQGVSAALEIQPDLILMDLQMPVLNGLDATQILKGNVETSAIPVIAVTARAMSGDRERVLTRGADDYIAKPIDPDEMLKKVRKWLS